MRRTRYMVHGDMQLSMVLPRSFSHAHIDMKEEEGCDRAQEYTLGYICLKISVLYDLIACIRT